MNIQIGLILYVMLSVHFAYAQKVYSKEEIDAIMNPPVLENAGRLLEFENLHIDSEELSEDDKPVEFIFKCRNISNDRIAITRITTSCGCTEAVVGNPVIKPGESTEFKVVFNPFGHPGSNLLKVFVYSSLSENNPLAVLTVNVDVTPSVALWKDYRYSMGKLRLRNRTVDMGVVHNGKRRSVRLACANAGSKPLKISAMKGFIPDFLALRTEPEVMQPSEEGFLILEFNGNIPDGISGKRNYRIILDGLDVKPSDRSLYVSLEVVK